MIEVSAAVSSPNGAELVEFEMPRAGRDSDSQWGVLQGSLDAVCIVSLDHLVVRDCGDSL